MCVCVCVCDLLIFLQGRAQRDRPRRSASRRRRAPVATAHWIRARFRQQRAAPRSARARLSRALLSLKKTSFTWDLFQASKKRWVQITRKL